VLFRWLAACFPRGEDAEDFDAGDDGCKSPGLPLVNLAHPGNAVVIDAAVIREANSGFPSSPLSSMALTSLVRRQWCRP
jgi:hypothetical protein